MFLYQNEEVSQKNMPLLKRCNDDPSIRSMTFKPYFHNDSFPSSPREAGILRLRAHLPAGRGQIRRQHAPHLRILRLPPLQAWPVLGFDQRSREKIGEPYGWIRTARDQREVSQQDFYKHCEIVLQPTDTTENWPRVGFEAMASGSVLVVDNRGGWRQMVEHGKTGWLCDHERDFIYYASKMAYEPNLRRDMAEAARERGMELGGWNRR